MNKYRPRKSFWQRYLSKKLKKYNILSSTKLTREIYLLGFFCFLFLIIVLRLFYLQVIKADHYETLLGNQHISQSLLKADRGHIFVYDESGKPVQLTENIMMYNIFVDPKFVNLQQKDRFIDIITPVVYEHLCVMYGMAKVEKEECVRNIEIYSQKDLLPKEPESFYYGSGFTSTSSIDMISYDWTGFWAQKNEVINNFTTGVAYDLIKQRLDKKIYIGVLPQNYVGFFSNERFLEDLNETDFPFVKIKYNNYVYIVPDDVRSVERDSTLFRNILDKYGYADDFYNLERKFSPQENRYVKILSNVNPYAAKIVKDLKVEFYRERTNGNVPILHGLGLEQHMTRYYPYGNFLSNVLGYVNKDGKSFYGVEQYFDEVLGGQDGEIKGRASAWIGQVGSNDFQIVDAKNGDDVYLTIDIGMQKEIEMIVKRYHKQLRADSVSVLVYDPNKGQIKASAMWPSYNPNNYNDAYEYMPLSSEHWYIVDDETYVDVPVFFRTGGEMKLATTNERFDTTIAKYLTKNIYGSQVFVDKNISMAYEPGSIFKSLTMGIGLDVDEVRFYDNYYDSGFVRIGPYKIKNVDDNCLGYNSFLHAWIYSCNVGMIRVVQKIGKESFYNYLQKLGFGSYTDIELANEDPGDVWSVNTLSKARFFNNAYGQGLTATPLQLAAAYGSLVNGGHYIKPTIVAGILDEKTGLYAENKVKIMGQVFRSKTSELVKEGLFEIMENNPDYVKRIRVEGFSLGGKSGTSQISYKGKYREGVGRTNASFVGFVSKEDPRYIVIIQVRRPRSSLWATQTAGLVFNTVARFLVNYSFIEG